MGTRFLKMNGLGNDFVVLDGRERPLRLDDARVRAIADRDSGIGCDQLIVLEPARDGGDVFMSIRNADGSTVEACGNASRCIARRLIEETGEAAATIETLGGTITGTAGPEAGTITIDMGAPRFGWQDIPLAEAFHDTRAIELQIGPVDAPVLHSPSVVNVGNPHAIFWVEDVDAYDLARFGPMLENHPIFPERANISLAQVVDAETIKLRVWERGTGLTRACGTAACATAVAAARKGLTGRKVTVHLPGGPLTIEWREADDHILMTGDANLDYEGELDMDLTAPLTADEAAAS